MKELSMKFENLHEGQVFKNYKELCATLEIEPTDGSSKRAQFKDLDTYCLYHKEGHKIIIDEIFEEMQPRVDNRFGSEYKEMKELILRLLLTSKESNRAVFSKPALLEGLGAINSNYSTGRMNQKELGKYLKIETEYVNDFYNSTHSNLKSAIETNLNALKRDNLILWGHTIMVCKNTPQIKLNELGEYQLDSDGRIVYEVRKNCRLATLDEKEFILKTEKQILNRMGYKDVGTVISHGKADEFYDKVNLILSNKCNINNYYKAYEIIFSREMIEKELEKYSLNTEEKKEWLNARVKDRIIFNAEDRKEEAMTIVSRSKKIQARRSEEFIGNMHKIIDAVIDLSAENIKPALLKDKKEKRK